MFFNENCSKTIVLVFDSNTNRFLIAIDIFQFGFLIFSARPVEFNLFVNRTLKVSRFQIRRQNYMKNF